MHEDQMLLLLHFPSVFVSFKVSIYRFASEANAVAILETMRAQFLKCNGLGKDLAERAGARPLGRDGIAGEKAGGRMEDEQNSYNSL